MRMFGGAGLGNLAEKSSPLGGLLQTASAFGGCIQHPSQPIGAPACMLSAPNPYSPKCDFGLPGNAAANTGSSNCTYAVGCVASCNPMKLLGSTASWTPDSFGGNKTYWGASTYMPYWGKDLNATYTVTTLASYTQATTVLRTWAGHNPFQSTTSGPGFWAYPPPHDLIDFNNQATLQGVYNSMISGAPATVINTTYATLGFRPLVVSHLGCGSFSFSTLDPSNATYWTEHWELYKFSYAASMWMWKYNITKAEVHNEPDLSGNNACMNAADPDTIASAAAYSSAFGYTVTPAQFSTLYWADYFAVRSVAHQDAYADANADVVAGNRPCPFPGACPITLNIYGSAMALSIGSPLSTPTTNQLGGAMLQNAYFRFPCTAATCVQSSAWSSNSTRPGAASVGVYPWGTDRAFTSFQIYSYHSYGNTGDNLLNKLINYVYSSIPTRSSIGTVSTFYGSNVFNWRGVATAAAPLNVSSPVTTLPVAVTEYASLTGADFGLEGSSSDSYYQASRLGTQLINFALAGQETYYFKFSMMPLGDTTTQAKTMVNKHGIHFAENNANSFQVGDQTTSGAVFALIAPYITGGKPLLSCSMADVSANWTWPTIDLNNVWGVACAVVKDGNVARIFLVNDCNGTPARNQAGTSTTVNCADRQINIPVASLSPDQSSVVSISQVSAPANTCVNQTSSKDKLTGGTRPCNDPALAGRFTTFTTTTSFSGYFGEVSNVVAVSAIPASGLPFLLPVFGFARIDIPLAPQKTSVVTTSDSGKDTTLFAGINRGSSYGNVTLLTVGTSPTAVHDSTGVALLQFSTPTFSAANLALLELTLANPPGNTISPNVTTILQVIGINPKQPVVWNEAAMTWANSQWLLNTPTGLVNSVGTNYVMLGPQNKTNPLSGIYNFMIGHISVSSQDLPGTVKKVDITRFVKRAQANNACSISIAIVRRFRKNTQFPASPALDTIPADSFTAFGSVSFYSGENSLSTAPTLRTFSDASSSTVTCNAQAQQNLTVSTTVGISNVNSATINGSISAVGRRLSQTVPSLVSSTTASISSALNLPSNSVSVSPTGTYMANLALSLSSNSPPDASVIQSALVHAANIYPSASAASVAVAGTQVIQFLKWNGTATLAYPNGTYVAMPNNVTSTTSTDASEKHGFNVASDAYPTPARRLLYTQDAPLTMGRKLLQQSYQVQVSFSSLAEAEAFTNSFVPGSSTVSSIVAFVNTNNSNSITPNPDLSVASLSTSNVPSVDTQVVVDVYVPYHSPSSADVVFNSLTQGSNQINQQFDATFHGDASDLQINPTAVLIIPGYQPQGSSAPSTAPELVIIVQPTTVSSTTTTNTMYTRANFIGLGVGLGVGEFFFFSVFAATVYFLYVKPLQAIVASAVVAPAKVADTA